MSKPLLPVSIAMAIIQSSRSWRPRQGFNHAATAGLQQTPDYPGDTHGNELRSMCHRNNVFLFTSSWSSIACYGRKSALPTSTRSASLDAAVWQNPHTPGHSECHIPPPYRKYSQPMSSSRRGVTQ
jgi:hypothetical protein